MKNPTSFLKLKHQAPREQGPAPHRDWKALLSLTSALALIAVLWSGYFFYGVVKGGFFEVTETSMAPELSLDSEKLSDTVLFYENRAARPRALTGEEKFFFDPSR